MKVPGRFPGVMSLLNRSASRCGNSFHFFLLANGKGGHVACSSLGQFIGNATGQGSLGLVCALLCALGRLRRATSRRREGEESTAFGWETAPNLIRVISSIGAALHRASTKVCNGFCPDFSAMVSSEVSKAFIAPCFLPVYGPVRISLLM